MLSSVHEAHGLLRATRQKSGYHTQTGLSIGAHDTAVNKKGLCDRQAGDSEAFDSDTPGPAKRHMQPGRV
eukprot:1146476-Pelagomonas_calceolata.AAC.6